MTYARKRAAPQNNDRHLCISGTFVWFRARCLAAACGAQRWRGLVKRGVSLASSGIRRRGANGISKNNQRAVASAAAGGIGLRSSNGVALRGCARHKMATMGVTRDQAAGVIVVWLRVWRGHHRVLLQTWRRNLGRRSNNSAENESVSATA